MHKSGGSSNRLREARQAAVVLLVLALFVSAFAPGAAAQPSPVGAVASPTVFVVATPYEPSTLDPALAYDTQSGEPIQNIYETLVFYDGDDPGNFVNQLADSRNLSLDGLTWTFHIRPDITFHNGAGLTAADVAYSLRRGILQGGSNSPQWVLTEPILGTGISDITQLVDPTGGLIDNRAALQAWTPADLLAACQQVKDAIVPDDAAGTVTIHLAQEWSPFLSILAGTWGSVMDKGWTIANGGWDADCATWQDYYYQEYETDPFSAIANGTGPFRLDHWTLGTELVMTRNDSYWRAPASLQSVVFQVELDPAARFALLQSGSVDEIQPSDPSLADALVGEQCTWDPAASQYDCSVVDPAKSLRRYTGRPSLTANHAMMNFDIAPGGSYVGTGVLGTGIPLDFFTDVHIRKAFNYCFDRAAFGDQAYGGAFVPATSLALEGMPGYSLSEPHYSYNLTQCAAELQLADADNDGIPGTTDSNDVYQLGFHFYIPFNTGNAVRQAIAQGFEAGFAAVDARFNIDTVGMTWQDFVAAQNAGVLPVFPAGWFEDYHDPHNWYQPYLVGMHASRAEIPTDLKALFQAQIDQGVVESDFAARHAIYHSLNQLVYDNAALVLIGPGTSRYYIQRRVSGQVLNLSFQGNYYYPISKPQLKTYSTSTYDGWVLESTESSEAGGTMNSAATTFIVGDNAQDKQYRAILSFNTSALPDNAIITKVTLKIRQQSIVGTNPFTTHNGLKVDIRKPYFGAASSLALGDFQAAPSLSMAGTFKSTPASGGWYSAIIKSTAYSKINLGGTTQFRLRFARDDNDDLNADYILFYSGNDLLRTNKPVLMIEYHLP